MGWSIHPKRLVPCQPPLYTSAGCWQHGVLSFHVLNREVLFPINVEMNSNPGKDLAILVSQWICPTILYKPFLFVLNVGRVYNVNPTLFWQKFAESETPGLTGVQVHECESKDTESIHGLVIL